MRTIEIINNSKEYFEVERKEMEARSENQSEKKISNSQDGEKVSS